MLTYIFQHFCNELKKEETVVFCVGNQAEELRQLHKSYETANQMAEVSALGRIPGEEVYGRHKMIIYKNAGIFRILFALKDEEVMQEYVRDTVNYKINKASEILEMDLTRLENRLEVMLGFGICQILHK